MSTHSLSHYQQYYIYYISYIFTSILYIIIQIYALYLCFHMTLLSLLALLIIWVRAKSSYQITGIGPKFRTQITYTKQLVIHDAQHVPT